MSLLTEPLVFLVRTDFVPPDDLDDAGIERLRGAERRRAAELQREGTLMFLWRERGLQRAWGVWRAADRDELDRAMSTLPCFAHMIVDVHAIEAHPNSLAPIESPRRNG